jgi:site-specific DNA-cytosine methylase
VDTTITTLEFCAGYGGIGLGLKNIFGERLRTIAYCELEGFAQANLISKMEKGLMDVAPIWNDLKTFPYRKFHGLVDIFVSGYPCQPFSSAGKRAGKEDPRHLWPWIADGIRLLQPRMCFLENVEGHISLGLSTVISDLEELGYKSSFGIFSASEVGAVHQRKRVFIMAHRSDEGFQGGKWFWKAGTQGSSSGHATECSSSMADSNGGGMSGSRNELGNSGEVGQGWTNTSQNGIIGNVWPSRPGQPQYAWEPPRVVANSDRTQPSEGRGDNGEVPKVQAGQWTDKCSALSGGEGEFRGEVMANPVIVGRGCQEGSELGNAPSKRSCGGSEDRANQQPEVLGQGHEAVGNSDCGRLSSGIDTGSCSETDSGGQDNIKQTECGKIKPEMGRNIDGTAYGVDIAELSSLCHSELAEIREWMVKGDNRTDELRSCGNGVVPATAERAFRVLMEELINK